MSNSLTVTEKNHWKDRIARRIDGQIDVLCAEEPEFMQRINSSARERALESLGISALHQRLEHLKQQEASLEDKRTKTYRQVLAKLRGVPLRQVAEPTRYAADTEISRALDKQQLLHADELLAETRRGRDILNLRMEKENLLDTVWLATSPKQIKELWQKVDHLLGGQQTALQRQALAIEPVDDNG